MLPEHHRHPQLRSSALLPHPLSLPECCPPLTLLLFPWIFGLLYCLSLASFVSAKYISGADDENASEQAMKTDTIEKNDTIEKIKKKKRATYKTEGSIFKSRIW